MKIDDRSAMLLEKLNGGGSDDEWAAVGELKARLGAMFPKALLERYKAAKSWRQRASCVYHAISAAKKNDDAVALGELALFDKSKVVRYRASMLLAIAQRIASLEALREALSRGLDSAADYRAAIDAIEHRNVNYFVDRDHSGQVTLSFGEESRSSSSVSTRW